MYICSYNFSQSGKKGKNNKQYGSTLARASFIYIDYPIRSPLFYARAKSRSWPRPVRTSPCSPLLGASSNLCPVKFFTFHFSLSQAIRYTKRHLYTEIHWHCLFNKNYTFRIESKIQDGKISRKDLYDVYFHSKWMLLLLLNHVRRHWCLMEVLINFWNYCHTQSRKESLWKRNMTTTRFSIRGKSWKDVEIDTINESTKSWKSK